MPNAQHNMQFLVQLRYVSNKQLLFQYLHKDIYSKQTFLYIHSAQSSTSQETN